ncbi:MAG: PAS domain S-box protein [Gammaproteobacteria bacterium]|nr:PAS domain S-box protein [Gammaproteobacteria bacterium]
MKPQNPPPMAAHDSQLIWRMLHPGRNSLSAFVSTLASLLVIGLLVAATLLQQGYVVFAVAFLLCAVTIALALAWYRITAVMKQLRRTDAMLSQWRQAFFSAHWGIALVSAYDHKLIVFNSAFAALHGGEYVTLFGLSLKDFIAPRKMKEVMLRFETILEHGHCHFETDYLCSDGSTLPVLIDASGVRTESGATGYLVLNVLDISERRLAERKLRESESDLAQAQAQACLGSWRLDVTTNDLVWSEECRRIFGVTTPDPLTYEFFLNAVHPEDRQMVDNSWQDALRGRPYDIQHRIVVAGEIRWVRERAKLIFSADGQMCNGLGTVQDITDMKMKELELVRSRQMVRELAAHNERIREEERGRIARELHDEMGHWLMALSLDAALLRRRVESTDSELNLALCKMKSNIDKAIKVVREIASNVRPEELDAGLIPAARWLLSSFEERTGVRCMLETEVDDFHLDQARTISAFRILQESLTNVARHAFATQVTVTMARDSREFTMIIRDDGVGFDVQAVRENPGFGLMGMRERVLIFGGASCIQAEPGGGTSVRVRIPLVVARSDQETRV